MTSPAGPSPENRAYLAFIGASLVAALAGGFALAVVLPLAMTGALPLEERVPRLIQAHGWAQLQGWSGLFIAGMSLRLVPLFSGLPAIRPRPALAVLGLLAASVLLRTVAQAAIDGAGATALLVLAAVSGAAGMGAVAFLLVRTLSRSRRAPDPWTWFLRAAAAWWGAWALLLPWSLGRAATGDGLAPVRFDDTLAWVFIFGPVANVIWGVQARSVPVFFGRRPPGPRVAIPGVAANLGAVLLLASLGLSGEARERTAAAGLLLCGAPSALLAIACGAAWGRAVRLRDRSRWLARYILAANIGAVAGGTLLALAGAHSLATGEFESAGLRDAARHALGAGLVTMLAVGMAQIITPVFAIERADPCPPGIGRRLTFWLLAAAVALRVSAGVFAGHGSYDARMYATAASGLLGWAGIALFALAFLSAVRKEPQMKELAAGVARAAVSQAGGESASASNM